MPPQLTCLATNTTKHFAKHLTTIGFGTEIIYSFVIIITSLMIYFGTKELYELSSHKGIKYFRLAFLYFAIAYFFRSFIKFILVYFNTRTIFDICPRTIMPIINHITLFIFIYFSSMAIFYLLYSIIWKKWNHNQNRLYLFHLLAMALSVIILFSKNPLTHLLINIFLLIFVILIIHFAHKQKEKKFRHNNLYTIYILLFIFWILNILDILIPNFFQTSQLFIYLASITVFLTILYRVLKKSGSN